ncbi:hypothetical protein SJAG_00016 [Schizosaccharomyces japonicus yFS275]|uniref:Uncharacterized protein n=1 Tax=Schizosaccharomyces japonicus (strain yFS275 / FY16936) TaxID=402676 RepID=B6JUV4_SCHJY|nr:hypothetical protein SJAG_00016 [Schizosaccharomyces japonicus yFS275]EEB05027.1 hypothetical protein SJAG_00016 [Schizosaccharomyces japonicus yFS275]
MYLNEEMQSVQWFALLCTATASVANTKIQISIAVERISYLTASRESLCIHQYMTG